MQLGGHMMGRRLADAWIEHPAIDYPLTLLAAGVLLLIDPRSLVAPADRIALYQTMAGVSGGLLALSSISVTVIFTVTPTDRLQLVLDLIGQNIRRLIFSCLTGLVATTGLPLVLFALDGASHLARVGLTTACAAFMALRFGRLWWLFNQTLKTLVRRNPVPIERASLDATLDRRGRLPTPRSTSRKTRTTREQYRRMTPDLTAASFHRRLDKAYAIRKPSSSSSSAGGTCHLSSLTTFQHSIFLHHSPMCWNLPTGLRITP